MIRLTNNSPKAMEFTRFRKKDNVTDDELLFADLKFETAFTKQNGVIFHCLVRNFRNEYANVLFADSLQDLKDLGEKLGSLPEVQSFFELIDLQSVIIEYHEIQKENFKIPTNFSCIEKGMFSLKNIIESNKLPLISENIENKYLNNFENTQAHFIGTIGQNKFSEITFGKTLAKTKQICFGYVENSFCLELLDLADKEMMELDFWYLIA